MGLEHRAKLDSNQKLSSFTQALKDSISITVDREGKMTKDLVISVNGSTSVKETEYLSTEDFMNAIQTNLIRLWTERLSKL